MLSLLIDSTYYVKVEYLNVTDSNQSYPYVLNGCPDVECPLEVFTANYKPRFPAGVDVECSKVSPPTPPGNSIQLIDSNFIIDIR